MISIATGQITDSKPRKIPRVVYQLAIGFQIPAALIVVRDRLIHDNPSWTFELLQDGAVESFIAEQYGQEMLSRYLRILPEYNAARADLARYLLLYRLGGLYLDLKSTADRALDDAVRADDHYILSQWRNQKGEEHFGWGVHPGIHAPGGALQQWFIATTPGHPFLQHVIRAVCDRIDHYNAWHDEVGASGVFKLTGPIVYTQAIWPIRHLYPHRLLRSELEAGLVYSTSRGLSHRALTRNHYARQRKPIIGPTPAKVVCLALALWQHLRDRPGVWRLRLRRAVAWLDFTSNF